MKGKHDWLPVWKTTHNFPSWYNLAQIARNFSPLRCRFECKSQKWILPNYEI